MEILTETCVECGNWGDSLTKGDGECTQCSGTGIDIGVAVLAGYAGDCEKCGGTGVCSACHGTGLRPASEAVDKSDSFENSTLNDKNQILTNELAEE